MSRVSRFVSRRVSQFATARSVASLLRCMPAALFVAAHRVNQSLASHAFRLHRVFPLASHVFRLRRAFLLAILALPYVSRALRVPVRAFRLVGSSATWLLVVPLKPVRHAILAIRVNLAFPPVASRACHAQGDLALKTVPVIARL